jgi:DNA polymerase I
VDKFIIIDGNAILHRAYHAYPPLTNNKGQVIQAAYGFFSMLFSIITDQKPAYLAVCFDMAAPTFRKALFVGYHANRIELPEDFIPQIVLVHEFLEKMKVSIFELEGYEADDLIGTLATRAVSQKGEKAKGRKGAPNSLVSSSPNIEVVIVTGDRDMLQLVNKQVKVLMPLLGITKTALFDEKAVEEKYGVTPAQFIDYKALVGDASDGYPGVTGIGPKGASNLLKEYGTFENLYQNIPKLPEKIGLKLATDAEQAALAKQLATIVTDAPIQFDIKDCKTKDFDISALRRAFEEQGFNTLRKRMDTVFGIETKETKVEKKEEEKEKPDSDQLELL